MGPLGVDLSAPRGAKGGGALGTHQAYGQGPTNQKRKTFSHLNTNLTYVHFPVLYYGKASLPLACLSGTRTTTTQTNKGSVYEKTVIGVGMFGAEGYSGIGIGSWPGGTSMGGRA